MIVAAIALFRRGQGAVCCAADAALAIFAGCLDVSGTALFIRAEQTGRLDSAVVLCSLYPGNHGTAGTSSFCNEQFTRWKTVGIFAAVAAVPLIALQ